MNLGFITIYKRDMIRFVRFKQQFFSSLLHPVLWIAIFGLAMAASFGSTSCVPVPDGKYQVDYLTFMCAGMIAGTVLFSSMIGGFFVLSDKTQGLMREVIASPVKRYDIILGLSLSSITKGIIQASIILIFGLLLGVSFFRGFELLPIIGCVLGVLLFVALFTAAFLCISVAISLKADSLEGFQAISNLIPMPLFFMSNALYPIGSLPFIFQMVATLNPLTHLILAIRYFTIGGNFYAVGTEYVYTGTDILISFVYLLIVLTLSFIVALRSIRKIEII